MLLLVHVLLSLLCSLLLRVTGGTARPTPDACSVLLSNQTQASSTGTDAVAVKVDVHLAFPDSFAASPGVGISLVSFASSHIASYARYSSFLQAQYAREHGYGYQLLAGADASAFQRSLGAGVKGDGEGEGDQRWFKVKVVLDALDASEGDEVIVWVDADAVVLDFNYRIESLLTAHPTADILVSRDYASSSSSSSSSAQSSPNGVANTGMLVVRRTARSTAFFRRWWGDFQHTDGMDQFAFTQMYELGLQGQERQGPGEGQGQGQAEVVILPVHALNSRIPAWAHQRRADPVLHLAGESNGYRAAVLRRAATAYCTCREATTEGTNAHGAETVHWNGNLGPKPPATTASTAAPPAPSTNSCSGFIGRSALASLYQDELLTQRRMKLQEVLEAARVAHSGQDRSMALLQRAARHHLPLPQGAADASATTVVEDVPSLGSIGHEVAHAFKELEQIRSAVRDILQIDRERLQLLDSGGKKSKRRRHVLEQSDPEPSSSTSPTGTTALIDVDSRQGQLQLAVLETDHVAAQSLHLVVRRMRELVQLWDAAIRDAAVSDTEVAGEGDGSDGGDSSIAAATAQCLDFPGAVSQTAAFIHHELTLAVSLRQGLLDATFELGSLLATIAANPLQRQLQKHSYEALDAPSADVDTTSGNTTTSTPVASILHGVLGQMQAAVPDVIALKRCVPVVVRTRVSSARDPESTAESPLHRYLRVVYYYEFKLQEFSANAHRDLLTIAKDAGKAVPAATTARFQAVYEESLVATARVWFDQLHSRFHYYGTGNNMQLQQAYVEGIAVMKTLGAVLCSQTEAEFVTEAGVDGREDLQGEGRKAEQRLQHRFKTGIFWLSQTKQLLAELMSSVGGEECGVSTEDEQEGEDADTNMTPAEQRQRAISRAIERCGPDGAVYRDAVIRITDELSYCTYKESSLPHTSVTAHAASASSSTAAAAPSIGKPADRTKAAAGKKSWRRKKSHGAKPPTDEL